MPDSITFDIEHPHDFINEIHTRLKHPPYSATQEERKAICKIITESPTMFYQAIADKHIGYPNSRDVYLRGLLAEYRGESVGAIYGR